MPKDSQLWEEAYKASKRMVKVPTHSKFRKPKKIKIKLLKQPGLNESKYILLSTEGRKETMVLMQELRQVIADLQSLTNRKRYLRQQLAGQKLLKNDYYNKPIMLYALRLENACYYVGMSRNPKSRFKKHDSAKGAMWTKLNKPIEIIEIRNTESTDDHAVSLLEDDMTLEYALKYGSEFVRGGGYCQRKPRWPDVIIQNEKF